MKRGEIYLSPKFLCMDGEVAKKYVIALCDCTTKEPACVVKTTSVEKPWRFEPEGCFLKPKRAYYAIPAKRDWFPLKTYVQFDEIHEYTIGKIRVESQSNNLIKQGQLSEQILNAILNCVKHSKDISPYHLKLIYPARKMTPIKLKP